MLLFGKSRKQILQFFLCYKEISDFRFCFIVFRLLQGLKYFISGNAGNPHWQLAADNITLLDDMTDATSVLHHCFVNGGSGDQRH